MNIKEPFVELDEIDEAVDLTAELEIKEEYIATADKEAIDPPLEMRVGEQNKTGSEKKHSSKINGTEENYYANVYLLNAAQKRYLVFKRALDIVISFTALAVLAIPLVIVILIQKISAPKEPVFFIQTRIGRNGIPFKLIKFRSMKSTAPHNCPTKDFDGGDQYITKFGRFLRNTSIDELPQLFQVLFGKMSLIGPRPLIPEEGVIHEMRKRAGVYQIRPGMSGLAQVNGRDLVDDEEKVRLDIEYIQNIGLKMDAKVFSSTIKYVVRGSDIEEGTHIPAANIIIQTEQYYPLCGAGAYRMKIMSDALTSTGHNVTVIASSCSLTDGKTEQNKTKERIIYSSAYRMKKKTTVTRLMNNLSFAFSSIFSSLRAGKADIVITTSPPLLVNISGWLIAKIKRAKLVYDVRDIWPDVALEMGSFSRNSLYCKLFTKMANFMYKHSDMITAVTPGKVEKIVEYTEKLGKKSCKRVELVGNGFDEDVLNNTFDQDIVNKYNLDTVPSCVFIGNIGLAQGLGHLLDIAEKSKHKEIRYLLFGNGAEREFLEKEAAKRGLKNVKFCGVLDHDKVYTVLSYAKLSFISLKNSRMTDSIPTKMYEALGIGCPVLLVAQGDSCEILKESGLGICVPPEDTEKIVESFDELLDNYDTIILNRKFSKDLMKRKYSRQSISAEFEKRLCEFANNT